jgi:hypothetical protein
MKCWLPFLIKNFLLDRLGWLSIRKLIFYNTVLQPHKTISSGSPSSIHQSIPTQTRNATSGLIRFGEALAGDSNVTSSTFKHRALHWFNAVPVSVRTGTLSIVNKKLRKWTWQNIPIDWG